MATIASGPLEGLKLAVSQHTSHAHIGGTYEIDTQLAVDRCVKPGFVCYDLGASIGFLTLVMARKASHVFCFEPAPHAAGELHKQIAINNFENVTIVPRPISDCDREVQFALTDVAYGSAIVTNSSKWPTLTLRTLTLDEFAATYSFPDFVKIDVEGEEGRVLAGARKILERRKAVFCCELHNMEATRQVVSILEEFGYRLTRLDGEPFVLRPLEVIPGELQIIASPCP